MSPLPRMAAKNVVKNWRHSFSSLISIAAGFFAIATFEGYIEELELRFADVIREKTMMGDVVVEALGPERGGDIGIDRTLDRDTQATVDAILEAHASEVIVSNKTLTVSGLVTSGKKNMIFVGFGYDVAAGRKLRGPRFEKDVTAGRALYEAGPSSIVAGEGLARLLGCELSDARELDCKRKDITLAATTHAGQLNAIRAEIAGTVLPELRELNVRFLTMPLPMAQRLLDTDRVSRYAIKLTDRHEAGAFAARLRSEAKAKGVAIDARRWDEHRFTEMYKQGMGMLRRFRAFVSAVVMVVVGMSVYNTMAKVVNERIREIGALRALGFLRRQIIALFVLEGGTLAALGIGAGMSASLLLAAVLNSFGLTYDAGMTNEPILLAIAIRGPVYFQAAWFLSSVAILATLLPARRAARLGIPDALTHA